VFAGLSGRPLFEGMELPLCSKWVCEGFGQRLKGGLSESVRSPL